MAPRSKRRMSAHEFDPLIPLLDISAERIAAARAVLVDDKTLEMAAAPYGWTRQAVNSAITIVWRTRERFSEAQAISAGALLPAGWELVTLVAPTSLVQKFKEDIAAHAASQTPVQAPAVVKARATQPRKKKVPAAS
jgi:hypothetical protein